MTPVKAVIFDLDGTLLNSLPDIAKVCNEMLQRSGHQPHPIKDYANFVGSGMRNLVKQALPTGCSLTEIDGCFLAMKASYERQCTVLSHLYAGVSEMLQGIESVGLAKAILTNKPHKAAMRCVDHYLHQFDFAFVVGQEEGKMPKPDPSEALQLANRLNVAPEEVCYVGDTAVDMHTAVNANFFPCGVGWGFRPEELSRAGALYVAQRPSDVLSYIIKSAK